MKYEAVIFDLFGTLVDVFSLQEHERVLAEMAVALSVPAEDFVRLWTRDTLNMRLTGTFTTVEANVEHICRALGHEVAAEQIARAAQMRLAFTRRVLEPRADAIGTLERLRRVGYKTALISDCSAEVPHLWTETPFAPLFDVTVFSCLEGVKKPEPRIYLVACDRLRVRPGQCLYVGDGSSHELSGASRVGMDPVLIRVPYEDSYDGHRPDAEDWQGATISALSDVPTLLTSFEEGDHGTAPSVSR